MTLLDESNAQEEIETSDKVIALFFAQWCPFCRAFKSVFESLALSSDEDFTTVDISHEESPVWERYDIEIVPTLIVFSQGETIARRDGKPHIGLSETDLRELIEEIRE